MLRCTPGICCQPSVRTPRASLWKPRILRAAYFPDPPLQPINIETRKAPMRRKGTKARGEHPAPGKCSVAIQAAIAEAFQVAEHSRIAADAALPTLLRQAATWPRPPSRMLESGAVEDAAPDRCSPRGGETAAQLAGRRHWVVRE